MQKISMRSRASELPLAASRSVIAFALDTLKYLLMGFATGTAIALLLVLFMVALGNRAGGPATVAPGHADAAGVGAPGLQRPRYRDIALTGPACRAGSPPAHARRTAAANAEKSRTIPRWRETPPAAGHRP